MKRCLTFDTGPKMCHLEIDRANPYVLSGGSPGRVKRIAQYLTDVELVESDRGLATVHGTYKDLPVTGFSTGMAPGSVSITMPEVIEACDDPKMAFIRIGTSGGCKEEMEIGDFVITTDVLRMETTSDKIMGEGYHAVSDNDVRSALLESVGQYKADFQSVYMGTTGVIDDLYFANMAIRRKLKSGDIKDLMAVSMEFSVFCALRDRYNEDYGQAIKAGNLLVVSDNVVADEEGNTDMTEFLRRQNIVEEAHIRSGLEALVKIANRPW